MFTKGLAIIFLQILAICATMFIIMSYYPKHGVIRYDCSIAEISPDYPEDVKQECRKLRAKNFI